MDTSTSTSTGKILGRINDAENGNQVGPVSIIPGPIKDSKEAIEDSRRLPLELIDHILGYCTRREDLLTWRTVNRDWNEFGSRRIRHSQQPIKISKAEQLDAFVTLLATRIQSTTFPFSAFKIGFDLFDWTKDGVERFSEAISPHVLSYEINLCESRHHRHVNPLHILLKGTPQLENLSVAGMRSGQSLEFPQILPKLKTLTMTPILGEMGIKVDVACLGNWLKNTPALQEFDCRFEIVDADFQLGFMKILTQLNFKQIQIHLSTAHLTRKCLQRVTLIDPKTRIRKFQLEGEIPRVEDDWTLLSKWLGTTTPNLSKLTVLGELELSVANFGFPNLETLYLDFLGMSRALRNSIAVSKLSAPALRTIILDYYNLPSRGSGDYELTLFNNESLPMVECLWLRGRCQDFFNPYSEYPPNILFPNLTSLHLLMDKFVCEYVSARILEFITTNYPNLIHLSIYEFDPEDELDYFSMLSGEENTDSLDKSFARFKELKTLEIGGSHKWSVLLAIRELTKLKKMSKLDYLGIYPSRPAIRDLENKELRADLAFCDTMVDSLKNYNWHKKISVDVKRSPHYMSEGLMETIISEQSSLN